MDELEEAGKASLEKMSAEHQFVWKQSRLKTLSEVEKVIEKLESVEKPEGVSYEFMMGWNTRHEKDIVALQSAIQEMKSTKE